MDGFKRILNNKRIFILLLIISLSVNIVLAYNFLTVNQDPHGYISYLTILKLDRQSNILNNLSYYFDKLQKNEFDVKEVQAYIKGVEEFLSDDIFRGASNYTYDGNEKIKNGFRNITYSILLTKNVLEKASPQDMQEISRIYKELSSLVNRNNGEGSLSYFLFNNDLNNPKLSNVLDELEGKVLLLEQYAN